MSLVNEFKQFALRGNVIDLAVGVVLGATFNAIVQSIVADIFMPVIGILTGGHDFSNLSIKYGNAVIAYGKFIQAIFVFFLTALALFIFIKAITRFRRKEEAKASAPAADIVLLTEIRDLLKTRG